MMTSHQFVHSHFGVVVHLTYSFSTAHTVETCDGWFLELSVKRRDGTNMNQIKCPLLARLFVAVFDVLLTTFSTQLRGPKITQYTSKSSIGY